jgi:LCP family protein required for cell wall assembly
MGRTRGTPPRVARVALATVSAATVLATLVCGTTGVALGRLESSVHTADIPEDAFGSPTPSPSQGADVAPQPVTLLLIGTDTRTGQGSGYGAADLTSSGFGHSDTTLVVHISADRSFAYGVSIPRDSWVTRPSCNPDGTTDGTFAKAGKFNTAYAVGGPACVVRAVRYLTGLPRIDHIVAVEFNGFQAIVDALGGVPICTNRALNDPKVKDANGHFHGSGLALPKGRSVLTGKQAIEFVRARYLDGTSDIGRMKRQQAFLGAVMRSVTSRGLLSNPAETYSLLSTIASSLTVDKGLAGDHLREFALSLQGLSPSHVVLHTLPWKPRRDGENVVWDTPAADRIWAAMKTDRPWPTTVSTKVGSPSKPTPSAAATGATPSASASASASSTAGTAADASCVG